MDKLIQKIYIEDVEYDNQSQETLYGIKVQEDFKIGNFTVENYLHGRCHLFALAINELEGLPIHTLLLPDTHYNPRDNSVSSGIILSHAYIAINNLAFDAQGISTYQNLQDKYTEVEQEYIFMNNFKISHIEDSDRNVAIIKSFIKKGLVSNFAKNEKENIQNFFTQFKQQNFLTLKTENDEIHQTIKQSQADFREKHTPKFVRM